VQVFVSYARRLAHIGGPNRTEASSAAAPAVAVSACPEMFTPTVRDPSTSTESDRPTESRPLASSVNRAAVPV